MTCLYSKSIESVLFNNVGIYLHINRGTCSIFITSTCIVYKHYTNPVVMSSSPATDIHVYAVLCWSISPNKLNLHS